MIRFLSQHPDHLFDALDTKAQIQLHENAEKLCGALALFRLRMDSTCLLRSMNIVTQLRGHTAVQLRNSGMSVCDAFFSTVSLLDQLFTALKTYLEDYPGAEALIESSVVICSIIEAAVQYRKDCNVKSLNNMWTTSSMVRHALTGTVLSNFSWIGYTPGDSETSLRIKCDISLVKELGEQTMAIGRLLLDGYFEHGMKNGELKAYKACKALVLNPLVCIGCHVGYNKVYSMCETYHYYVGLFECIMKMNDTSTTRLAALTECCSQFASDNFYYQLYSYFGKREWKNPWSKDRQGTSTTLLRRAMLSELPHRFQEQLQEYRVS